MLRYLVILTGLAIVLAVVSGCDDRGTNIQPVDLDEQALRSGVDPSPSHAFTPELTLQIRNSQELLRGAAFLPFDATSMGQQRPIPLLILLAPEGGNQFYYFKAGLAELARELMASGEIQPMVIYCMSNDQTFGGYFYADSDPAGHYDEIFRYTPGDGDDDLLEYLHRFYPATIKQASKRGIGGVGQGAYGAFRAAIKNPGVYSSISVTDGPLDFNGSDDVSGLIGLFDDALVEQHANYALNPDTNIAGDPLPFDFNRHFDSSLTMPISQMFIGGSFAFSPNDTLIDYDRIVDTTYGTNPDTIYTTMRLVNVVQYQIADSTLPGGGDSTTFISGIVRADSRTRFVNMDFHLPFDNTGFTYGPVWSRWMANNLENMHEAAGGNPLTGVSMWFGTNRHARWDYYDMTQSWISYLRTPGFNYAVEEYEYSSFTDDPITGDEYLFDILREMLIFHSNNFGD